MQIRSLCTLEFLSKKHVKFDQGLDFLIFLREIEAKTKKNIRNTKKKYEKAQETRGKAFKKLFF